MLELASRVVSSSVQTTRLVLYVMRGHPGLDVMKYTCTNHAPSPLPAVVFSSDHPARWIKCNLRSERGCSETRRTVSMTSGRQRCGRNRRQANVGNRAYILPEKTSIHFAKYKDNRYALDGSIYFFRTRSVGTRTRLAPGASTDFLTATSGPDRTSCT